jgi:hypothetical protein
VLQRAASRPVVALLAGYGLLLLSETLTLERTPLRSAQSTNPGYTLRTIQEPTLRQRWLVLAYLLVQSSVVVGLLLNKIVQDTYALLFLPLSLPAVLFLGRRLGFLCIAGLALAAAALLLAARRGGFSDW